MAERSVVDATLIEANARPMEIRREGLLNIIWSILAYIVEHFINKINMSFLSNKTGDKSLYYIIGFIPCFLNPF